ncbi:uncharacterized protein LOC111829487 [Capsella rubella]|uniref:uncharacterized protein LOC111829487 n=1 Tax=Capsella rubella TaxID=81985 RepID=UPI000CD5414F|nr:uncharacterized protein LOC111829487 [Capsella rubella]
MSMALPLSFTPLKDLKPYKNSHGVSKSKFFIVGECFQLTLGDKMGASIRKDHMKKFENSLRENDWKIITSFGLHPCTGMFRPSHLKYKITTRYGTTINQSEKASDDHYLSFTKFDDILAGTLDKNILFDTRYIENAFESSILMINPQIQEILPNDGLALTINSSGDKGIYIPKNDNEGIDYPRVTISEMLAYSQAGNCRLICTISGIDTDMGWYYFCCRPCNKKVFKDDAVKIEDVKKQIKPSWAKNILGGAPASEFLNGSFGEIEDPNSIPDQIKALVGKTFQFLITVGNENVYGGYEFYKVSNVWSGEKFIEIANEESESYLEHNSILSSDQASLMITNGTEPYETDLSSTSTPSSKRKSDSSGNGSDRSSSTKKLCSKIDTIHVDGEEVVRKDLNEEITRQEEDQVN